MAKKTVAKKAASKTERAPAKKRVSWLSTSGAPLIDDYARKLGTFMEALADGEVDDGEVKAQEDRLVKLMKVVEPLLDDVQHAKVTQLLCELTAYDIMQILNSMHRARPTVRFRG